MLKTPSSTVIGGAGIWTPSAWKIGLDVLNLGQLIRNLFSNSEQGFAYDINDLSTLFQDAAGTIPVTGAGQPVGLVLDKSKGLVLGSEVLKPFTDPGWTLASGISAESDSLFFTNAANGDSAIYIPSPAFVPDRFYVVEFDFISYTSGGGIYARIGSSDFTAVSTTLGHKKLILRAKTGNFLQLAEGIESGTYTLSNITVKELSGNHAYQTTSASRPILRQSPILGSELVVNGGFDSDTTWSKGVGWTIAGGKSTASNSSSILSQLLPVVSGKKYLASFTVSDYVSGALQIRSGSTTITYFSKNGTFVGEFTAAGTANIEFVATSLNASIDNVTIKEITSYYTDRNYLEFDGTDDFLVTNSIDFTATDKISLFAGVRKLTDGTFGIIAEHGTDTDVYASFAVISSAGEGYYLQCGAVGNRTLLVSSGGVSAPRSDVVASKMDRAKTDISEMLYSINGQIMTSNLVALDEQGATGNFANQPLSIGRRGGTTLPFNGHIYSLIGIGRLTTDAETTALEKAIAKNVGVTL